MVGIIIAVLLLSMTACGKSSDSNDEQTSVTQSEEIDQSIQDATNQQATLEQALPTVDPNETADVLIGSWYEKSSPEHFVNITKVEEGYQVEDNDGKYAATFGQGILTVKVSDTETDTASIFYDAKSGRIILVYQDVPTQFEKK